MYPSGGYPKMPFDDSTVHNDIVMHIAPYYGKYDDYDAINRAVGVKSAFCLPYCVW